MKIYIDNEYKCHTEFSAGLREVETSFFDGKCKTFIEGYRFVPEGESYVDGKGNTYIGQYASPFVDYDALMNAQKESEKDTENMAQLMNDIESLCNEIIGG